MLSSQTAILLPNFANYYRTIAEVQQIDNKEWVVMKMVKLKVDVSTGRGNW